MVVSVALQDCESVNEEENVQNVHDGEAEALRVDWESERVPENKKLMEVSVRVIVLAVPDTVLRLLVKRNAFYKKSATRTRGRARTRPARC
jgi:hypothetical protein